MRRIFLIGLTLFMLQGCLPDMNDTFNRITLVSSKQERIYINTLNWGMTDDHQLSAISGDKDKLRERSDGVGVVKGLEPFFYTFKNDTLNLYFKDNVNYRIAEKFKTIHVNYVLLGTQSYYDYYQKAIHNSDGYKTVPNRYK